MSEITLEKSLGMYSVGHMVYFYVKYNIIVLLLHGTAAQYYKTYSNYEVSGLIPSRVLCD